MTEPTSEPIRAPRQEGKITGQQRDEVRDRYQDGETAERLAEEFGITAGYVRIIAGKRA
jgi:hypothetical protein